MATFAIKADRFVLPGATMQGGYLTIDDGVFGAWSAEEPDCEVRDYTGCIVGPGLVDTHIHGFYNHATTDREAEGINLSSIELARRGTTCWLPTTFTESVEQIADSCAAIAAADEARDADFCRCAHRRHLPRGPLLHDEARGRPESGVPYRARCGCVLCLAGEGRRPYR